MTDSDKAAEIAEMKARLAVLEGTTAPPTPKPSVPVRRVGILLFIGIMLMPYFFVWFLLRKGHSPISRVIGFGWLILLFVVIGASKSGAPGSSTPSTVASSTPTDPEQHTKDVAAAVAKMVVPKGMKDPASAQFGQVWGMGKDIACGFVNGKNSFGALTGQQRFIFLVGQTEFDDGSSRFAKHWNTICVDKLLSTAPIGALGKRWGSAPTSDLKVLMPPTDEGLSLYVPKAAPAPFEGVPVKEADYRYDHHHLYSADFYIDGEAQIEVIKTALVKKYGTPLEYDDSAHSYKWSWPNRKVTVQMSYQERSKRTTVTFAHGDH
jgi:hypothetical protein